MAVQPCTNESRCRGRITCSTGRKIPYYRTYRLGTSNRDIKRAIIVIHGVNRNADSYFSHVVRATRAEQRLAETLIVAPQFRTRADDPPRGEHFWSGGWSSGDTRYFQVWYRDPIGGPCGSGFNLTSGVEATFAP